MLVTDVVQLNFGRLWLRKQCQSLLLVFLTQRDFELLDVSNSPNFLDLPGLPQSDHTTVVLSADASSLWNTVKQASRPQFKTQPNICLDYNLLRCNTYTVYNLIFYNTTRACKPIKITTCFFSKFFIPWCCWFLKRISCNVCRGCRGDKIPG